MWFGAKGIEDVVPVNPGGASSARSLEAMQRVCVWSEQCTPLPFPMGNRAASPADLSSTSME